MGERFTQNAGNHQIQRCEWIEAYTIAELSTLIGEREQAFQYLNEAVKFRSLEVSNIKGDPGMDPLRDDARFNELIRQIEQRNKK